MQADKRQQFVAYILNLFPVVPVDLAVTHQHTRIWADLQARGQVIGAHDLLIAASARAIDDGVITFNVDEFRRVIDLQVVKPLAD